MTLLDSIFLSLSDWRLKMSQFYEDTVQSEDRRPCSGLREELKFCLLESDCVKKVISNCVGSLFFHFCGDFRVVIWK